MNIWLPYNPYANCWTPCGLNADNIIDQLRPIPCDPVFRAQHCPPPPCSYAPSVSDIFDEVHNKKRVVEKYTRIKQEETYRLFDISGPDYKIVSVQKPDE